MALVKSGPSRIAVISKISKVARPDVYKTLSKLQQLCLVEKIIKRPLTYRAIPIDKGLSFLLETKTKQYKKVKAETEILRDTIKIEKPNAINQMRTPQFVLIPEGRNFIERINTAIAQAQLSIDFLLSWKRFSQGIVNEYAESIESAWAKNVKIRFIIQSPSKSKTAKQLVQFCREKPSCQIKFMRDFPRTIFGIFDKKEIFIPANPKTDLQGSPALWSNNPSLIALAEEHFEILWLTAMEEYKDPREPKK
jgi:sugar-specific transcriptional regulator TrmB